jgi:6-pyruvoyl-tetrahydropterin synthase related domain
MGKEFQIKSPAPWARRGLIVFAALIAGAVLAAPFYRSHNEVTPDGKVLRAIATHDLAQHLAVMEQFDKVLRSGVFYPRWLPDVNKGYGLAWTNFYPPGFYYLTSLVNLAVRDWMTTLFLVTALGFAASGLTFYLLARQFYGRLASAVAALLYMTAPYHVLDLYWRGAMPEFAGFILAPLIIYFAFKLGTEGRARHYAGLGLFHGLFLMTHIPVALLMTYALGFYALVWAARERDWRIALRVSLGISIALIISAIYWIPSFLELKYAGEPFSNIFPYHSSYITLLPDTDEFRAAVNSSFAAQAAALLGALAILHWVRRPPGDPASVGEGAREPGDSQTVLWIVMALTTTFMCTSFSVYVSKLLPKIDIASFAWRWLVLVALFVSLVVAAAIDRLRACKNLSPIWLWASRAGISAVILLNIWITLYAVIGGALSHPAFNPPPWYVESGFIPRGATDPHSLPETAPVMIQPPSGTVEISRWDPAYREIIVKVSEPSQIRLRTYNFRGWVARIDGQRTPILSDPDGAQQIDIPAGTHDVQVSFATTGPRVAGTVLSAIGLLAIIGLTFKGRSKEGVVGAESSSTTSPVDDRQAEPGSITNDKTTTDRFKRFAAILIVLLVGTAIIVMTMRRSNSAITSPSNVKNQPGASSSTPTPSASQGGDFERRLYLAGRESVMGALDEAAWDDLITALSTRDESMLESLTGSGRVLKLENDTRVRPLETIAGRSKVRILEGPHMWKEVWVGERWLR